MSTVEEITSAIAQLSPEQVAQIRAGWPSTKSVSGTNRSNKTSVPVVWTRWPNERWPNSGCRVESANSCISLRIYLRTVCCPSTLIRREGRLSALTWNKAIRFGSPQTELAGCIWPASAPNWVWATMSPVSTSTADLISVRATAVMQRSASRFVVKKSNPKQSPTINGLLRPSDDVP